MGDNATADAHHKLWYTGPARDWLEGLPIGSGRLAAMVMGSHKRERVALNHEWLWKGPNRHRDNKDAAHLLPEVRELLLAGKYDEGTKAGNDAFGSMELGVARVDPYQPAGDLYFELNHNCIAGYRRELDLKDAAVTVTYGAGQLITREYIAHLTKDVILVRIAGDSKPFDCTIWLDRNHDPDCALTFTATESALAMDGDIKDGIEFRVESHVWHTGGTASVIDGHKILVEGATEIIIATDVGTSATGQQPEAECAAKRLPEAPVWADLFKEHVEENARHYGGFNLDLPLDEPDLPTDVRMRRVRDGESDPALALLYFNFGRYLLCASSANGQLPANIQGKWNEDLDPPWQADYHGDINLEMNYWIAEPGGMADYAEALLQHIERLAVHGKKAAMDLYGCRGVWCPIQTDAWARATPESWGWAAWIGGAPWFAQHMWWHYEYGRDKGFLLNRAYPFIKAVATFYEDYLIEDADGDLQIVPSQSPENRFVGGGEGVPVSLCVSATMDVQLANDLLSHAIKASEILGVDAELREVWAGMLERLPKMQIGSKGQLLEWNEEFEEAEPGHRHISHLFGLYPGEQITPDRTPELFAAARRSLELRLEAFGGHTGWSRAWVACCFARLGEGDQAFDHVQHLVTDFATDTLLDLHPPRVFQIDGNFGGAAAVVEMLLQSYYEEIDLLPALPSAWPEGKVTGLRARGGYRIDIEWKDGALSQAEITPVEDRECIVKTGDASRAVTDAAGNAVTVREADNKIAFDVAAGETYTVTCP